MKNNFEVRGEITAIFLDSPKYGPMETIISTSKLGKAMEFPNTWYPCWNVKLQGFYCMGKRKIKGKDTAVLLHRWLTECPEDKQVDHINNNTLDNTSKNLRLVTHAQNMQNRKGAYRNSKSKVRGVYWDDLRNKWRASIRINGKTKNLGRFETLSEAEQVVKSARTNIMPFSNESAG